MKKILSVLLVLALLFSLVACGNDNSTDEPKNDNSSKSGDKTSSEPITSNESVTSSTPSSSSQSTSSSNPVVPQLEQPQFSTYTEDVYSNVLVRYQLNSECKGYYFTPKAAGKYPTVIAIHGAGGVNSFKERLLSSYNEWVKAGYIPPMVVVIPEVSSTYNPTSSGYDMQDFQFFIKTDYPNRFDTLLKSIEEGTLSSQIGTDKAICVTGFSMGGMAAIYAGAQYPTRIKYVGGLSPSQAFYLGENGIGFYKKAEDIHFSKEPDAHVYMSGGKGEDSGAFVTNIKRYKTAISVNTPNIAITYEAPKSWGGHAWALAQKELFMYMYFVTCGEIPSERLVEKVCNNPNDYIMPKIVSVEKEHT